MIHHEVVKVTQNRPLSPQHFRLSFDSPAIAATAQPGQFIHLRFPGQYHPLLRRPFSIEKLEPSSTVDIIYDVVGIGTNQLATLKPDDTIDVLGPLGQTFKIDSKTKHAYLIGGGVGIPPLVFLTEDLQKRGITLDVFLGGKNKDFILCETAFERLGAKLHVATDDGSRGYRGYVPELFREVLSAHAHLKPTLQVFSCGPTPMMKRVSEIVREYKVNCQHSLEERMGCGLGVCIGCVTSTVDGYLRVCREGPVFADEKLTWEHTLA